MELSWDESKRQATRADRGLDFADAGLVFAGRNMTWHDERYDYGEQRFVTVGWLHGRFVLPAWTPRDDSRRIISMRYGHGQEEERYQKRMD
ncbi:MAG: BrnT family toxin [Alphaproteobacteria bacterium]|nr:BrnT family toxin [Alphaproteobacteria bacterium]